jgi:hypothetical protein
MIDEQSGPQQSAGRSAPPGAPRWSERGQPWRRAGVAAERAALTQRRNLAPNVGRVSIPGQTLSRADVGGSLPP